MSIKSFRSEEAKDDLNFEFLLLQISRTAVSIYSDINEIFVILEGSGGGKVVGMLWMGGGKEVAESF